MNYLIDVSTPEGFLELFSTIAVILVIGVLVVLYIAYYWQTNHAKRRHAEAMKNRQTGTATHPVEAPSVYTSYSVMESN